MQKVKRNLLDANISVWTDEGIIPGTPDWQRAIEGAIRQCRGLVVILSPDAFASEWVRREISRAINLQRTVFPMLLRGEKADAIPISLENTQYIDLRTDFENGLALLISGLNARGWSEVGQTTPNPRQGNTELVLPKMTFPLGPSNPGGIEWVKIPAGEFLYGDDKKRKYIRKPYFIGKYPVTNAQYKLFIDANPAQRVPNHWDENSRSYPLEKVNHPVAYVSWEDATTFCKWNACRLPTEQEWEKAARGEDWLDGKYANSKEAEIESTTPVDDFSEGVSPYGAWDMSGNVCEWTDRWYDDEHESRVLRGGSWDGTESGLRSTSRDSADPTTPYDDIGFRCVSSP